MPVRIGAVRWVVCALALLLGAWSARAPAARAAYPGANGMLAFVNSLGGWSKDFELLRVNPDGSGLNALAAPFEDVTINQNPEWSPSGNQVVYERFRAWGGAIHRADADGGGELLLTPPGVVAGRPTWSPDGSKIAYRRYSASNTADASLWVMNADGSDQHEVIADEVGEGKCSAWLSEMDWGVNDRIAFVAACTSGAAQGWGLWTAKGDGTDLQTVSGVPDTLAVNAGGLDWSPDAEKIVLSSWDTQYPDESLIGGCGPTVNALDLFVVDVGASTVTKLTATSGRDGPHEVDPAWSPDGSRIAFAAGTLTCSGTVFSYRPSRLYTMSAGGGGVQVVTDPQPGSGEGPYGTYTIDTNDTAVDWQPCVSGVTTTCSTVSRPRAGAAPSISGDARVGSPLTCQAGTWADASSFSYQWNRGGTAIAGATGTSYTPVAEDDGAPLTCAVTASGPGGATTAESAQVIVQSGVPGGGGTPGEGQTRAAPTAAAVIGLPSSARCVSRRALTIHLRRPPGERLRAVTTRIGAGPVRRATRRLTAPIVLRGLPKGRWTVRVVVTTDKRVYRMTRRYRTCAARRS